MHPRGIFPKLDLPSSQLTGESTLLHTDSQTPRPRRTSFQQLASGPFPPPSTTLTSISAMSSTALCNFVTDTANVVAILASFYAFPCCLWKLATYVAEHKRRKYPCESMKSAARHWLLGTQPASPCGPSPLDKLPAEIIVHICQWLPAESVVNFGLTCHRLHRITHADALWLILLQRDFRERMIRVFPKSGPSSRRRKAAADMDQQNANGGGSTALAPSDNSTTSAVVSASNANNPRDNRKRTVSTSRNRRWQYRVLAETAAVCSPCQCPPIFTPSLDTIATAPGATSATASTALGTCYACLARAKRASFWSSHRASWSELALPRRQLLSLLGTYARSKLHHVPLTPVKIAGVVVSLPLLAFSHFRLSRMVHHGLFGHVARDLHSSTVAILRESAVEDGHWLVVTAPLTVAALGMRDLDVLLTKIVARADLLMAVGKAVVVGSAVGITGIAGYILWQVVQGGRPLYSL